MSCAGAIAFAALLPLADGADAAALRHQPFLTPRMPTEAPTGFDGVCSRYSWACARASARAAGNDDAIWRVARQVNSIVNRRFRQVTDRAQYRQDEVWALPTRRGGDCEDFALEKKLRLIKAGVPAGRLLIATALDRMRNSHAVLIVRLESGDFVLDNKNRRILHWEETGYSFLKLQNPDRPNAWDAVLSGGIFG